MMTREEIIVFLGSSWGRTLEVFSGALATDMELLRRTNDSILSNPGKCIRPILSLLVAKVFGEPNGDSCRFAAAVELLHNATLIHDDVADNSFVRRGAPTVMADLGKVPAVLVGDFWLARALDVIMGSERRDIALRFFSKTICDLAEGEMLQLQKAACGDTTIGDYLKIVYCKTASLFETATVSGAASVDAAEDMREVAGRYAVCLGTAFQIRDDILDFGDAAKAGKSVGVDIREGKITVPLLCALEGAPEEEDIRGLMREMASHPEYGDEVRRFVDRRGGVRLARRVLEKYVDESLDALGAMPPGKVRDLLSEFTAMIRKV